MLIAHLRCFIITDETTEHKITKQPKNLHKIQMYPIHNIKKSQCHRPTVSWQRHMVWTTCTGLIL